MLIITLIVKASPSSRSSPSLGQIVCSVLRHMGLSAEYVGQVVLGASYVLYSVIIDLEIRLYIYHPRP